MVRHLILIPLAIGLVASCSDVETARERGRGDRATRVIAHEVLYRRDARLVEAVGTARAEKAAILRPETGGEVETVSFRSGDLVEAGQPLLQLEAAEERLAARLATVSLAESQQLLERYRRIEDTGAVSDTAIDEARTAVESAAIALEGAELALARRTVRAPFAGHVGLTDIDAGARVTPDTEVTRLDDRRTLYVDFPVPEEVYGQFSAGSVVELVPFGTDAIVRQAEVIALDSRIDAVSRAFTARAAIDNEDDALRPGMSFRVRFGVPGGRYPAVPEAAIVWGGDGAYLWAVRNNAATRVPVTIISRREGEVLVDAPLPEGSMIVAEGVQKMREGSNVEVVGSAGPQGPSAATVPGAPVAL